MADRQPQPPLPTEAAKILEQAWRIHKQAFTLPLRCVYLWDINISQLLGPGNKDSNDPNASSSTDCMRAVVPTALVQTHLRGSYIPISCRVERHSNNSPINLLLVSTYFPLDKRRLGGPAGGTITSGGQAGLHYVFPGSAQTTTPGATNTVSIPRDDPCHPDHISEEPWRFLLLLAPLQALLQFAVSPTSSPNITIIPGRSPLGLLFHYYSTMPLPPDIVSGGGAAKIALEQERYTMPTGSVFLHFSSWLRERHKEVSLSKMDFNPGGLHPDFTPLDLYVVPAQANANTAMSADRNTLSACQYGVPQEFQLLKDAFMQVAITVTWELMPVAPIGLYPGL